MARTLVVLAVLLIAASAHADGLYVRFGAGPGVALGSLATDAPADHSVGADLSTELAVGYAVAPGLVVGGGTYPMVVPSPSYHAADAGGQHVSATGPFADYAPDPHAGIHVQAGALFALGYLTGSSARASQLGVGVGAMVGVGYDWRLGRRWRIGPLARITGYDLRGVDRSIVIASPALLCAITWQ